MTARSIRKLNRSFFIGLVSLSLVGASLSQAEAAKACNQTTRQAGLRGLIPPVMAAAGIFFSAYHGMKWWEGSNVKDYAVKAEDAAIKQGVYLSIDYPPIADLSFPSRVAIADSFEAAYKFYSRDLSPSERAQLRDYIRWTMHDRSSYMKDGFENFSRTELHTGTVVLGSDLEEFLTKDESRTSPYKGNFADTWAPRVQQEENIVYTSQMIGTSIHVAEKNDASTVAEKLKLWEFNELMANLRSLSLDPIAKAQLDELMLVEVSSEVKEAKLTGSGSTKVLYVTPHASKDEIRKALGTP